MQKCAEQNTNIRRKVLLVTRVSRSRRSSDETGVTSNTFLLIFGLVLIYVNKILSKKALETCRTQLVLIISCERFCLKLPSQAHSFPVKRKVSKGVVTFYKIE